MDYEYERINFWKHLFRNLWKILLVYFASWIALNGLISCFGVKVNEFVVTATAVIVVIVGSIIYRNRYMKKDDEWLTNMWISMFSPIVCLLFVCCPISCAVSSWNRAVYVSENNICHEPGCNNKRKVGELNCSRHSGFNFTYSYSSSNSKAKDDNKSNSKHRYNTSYSHDFDPDDYDSAEDFADDAWGDFNDWDSAYDYWDDY